MLKFSRQQGEHGPWDAEHIDYLQSTNTADAKSIKFKVRCEKPQFSRHEEERVLYWKAPQILFFNRKGNKMIFF